METTCVIKVCRALIEESGSLLRYTEELATVGEGEHVTAALLDDIRLDELEHIQRLTLELSRLLVGGEGELVGEEGGET